MIFTSSGSKLRNCKLNIMPSNNATQEIKQTHCYKYLGIWVDIAITFQVYLILFRVKNLHALEEKKFHVQRSCSWSSHATNWSTFFLYGDMIYDGCCKVLKQQLQSHQNMVLRAVLNVDRYFPTKQLHSQTDTDWLDVLPELMLSRINLMFPTPGAWDQRSNNAISFVPHLNNLFFLKTIWHHIV